MLELSYYLNILFREGEYINACSDVMDTSIRPLESVRGSPKWVCCNPLVKGGSRKRKYVKDMRNIVVEFDDDTMTPYDQLAHVNRLGMPYSTAVFSGNKSVHFVIALNDPVCNTTYKQICARIKKMRIGNDPACLEPCRLTRAPGVGQELLVVNGNVEFDRLDAWLPEINNRPLEFKYKDVHVKRLTKKTRQFLAGQVPKDVGHAAAIHAAKNLTELGMKREQIVNAMRNARALYLPEEDPEDNHRKTMLILNWVWNEWME